MPHLPTFSVDHRVNPAAGREDKIELDLGVWVLEAPTSTLDSIRNYIARPPEETAALLSPGDPHHFGWIFNRPGNPGARRKPMEVRTNSVHGFNNVVLMPPPLFKGRWLFSYRANQSAQPLRLPTYLRLFLNPLRFIRHQPIARPLPARNSIGNSPVILWESPVISDNAGEYSLDGNDNWLPDTSLFNAWTNPSRWPLHLHTYFRSVAAAFEEQLESVTHQEDTTFAHYEDFALRTVEIAWEFRSHEPTELVRSLAPHLVAYRSGNNEIQEFRVRRETWEVNSLSVKIALSANCSLRVYAKTNRRVRFEVIYKDINHRELLEEPRRPRGERILRQWDEIERALAILRMRGANALNEVLEFLQRRTQIARSHISGFSFMMRVIEALRDEELARTVISLLTHRGVIAARKAGDPILDACRTLASTPFGVLTCDPRRGVYEVTASYAHALSMLRACKSGNILSTARTRRRNGLRS